MFAQTLKNLPPLPLVGERRTIWLALVVCATLCGLFTLNAIVMQVTDLPWQVEGMRNGGWAAITAGTLMVGVLGLLSELHRRGVALALRAVTLLVPFITVPGIHHDAFAIGMPQAVWIAPMLAFALTSVSWGLVVTAIDAALVLIVHGNSGAFHGPTKIFVFLMLTTLLAAGKRRQEQLLAEQKVEAIESLRLAMHDGLTHLPNRRLLYDRLTETLKLSARSGHSMAVIFISLDSFKDVNTTLGHEMGDAVLLEAVRRMQTAIRPTDTLARFGGALFTIVLGDVADRAAIDRIADNVQRTLSQTCQALGHEVECTASVGVSTYPDDGDTADLLLMRAEAALRNATDAARVVYYERSMQEEAAKRLAMGRDLRGALSGNQLAVHYQPIIDLRTGQVHKAEALLRWTHPTQGAISPAVFIPIAEASGSILEIGDWVFQQAANQVKDWRDRRGLTIQISVNRSPVQFGTSGRPPSGNFSWPTELERMGLPGDSIAVEITEGLLLTDGNAIQEQLESMRSAGIRISLDDFGTGYSALAYLQRYPIDVVKIDRAFVRALTPGSKNMALCRAIIQMAHELGMLVVAEGVETADERDLLVTMGCDFAQGYLFGKPMPPEELEHYLCAAA